MRAYEAIFVVHTSFDGRMSLILISCRVHMSQSINPGAPHMSADIICVYYDPLFTQIIYPMTPFFHYSSHPMTPFFKISNFLRAFQKFCQFSAEKVKFDKNYTKWPPILGSSHQKRPIFFYPTPNDHLFSTKFCTECPPPCFRSPVGTMHIPVTFIFECPPPGIN